jgi:periplasmic divalent cation tolerance protein
MPGFILVLTTIPDEEKARDVAEILVRERLAACVTISAACQSFYWWEENISRAGEMMLFIKTRAALYDSLESRIKEVHPYQVPEIIALPLVRGYGPYLDWLAKETAG